jgi:hypothetical protein
MKNIKFETIHIPSIFISSKLKYYLVNIGILSPIKNIDNTFILNNPKN